MLHSEYTAMLLPHYHPYTLTPLPPPSYHRHCGLRPAISYLWAILLHQH
ncbi:MAG: hypothetical protein ACRC3G_06195 [Bacteroidales bacterium]